MKKLFSFIVPLLALALLFVPQSARAELDVEGNLNKPLTIETTTTASGGKIEFRHVFDVSGSAKTTVNLEYRMQVNGGSWGEWTAASVSGTTSYKQLYTNSITLSASTTYKIQFRGYNPSGWGKSTSTDYYRIILGSGSTSWRVTMSGNIMSLITGYDTSDETAAQETLAAADVIPSNACFFSLFNNYVQTGVGSQGEPNSTMLPPIINAENLIFPATTLTNDCYRMLFYTSSTNNNSATLISSYGGGLNEGPCFLATEFGSADNAFRNVFTQCSSLNSAHFNFTACPTGDNMTSWIYATGRNKTLYAPAAFTACTIDTQNPVIGNSANWDFNENKQWSGSVVWSYGAGSGGGEPGGGSVSDPAAVNVYQTATADTMQIVYDYPATVTGSTDGLTYGLVDMGYGIIWADRNVGATSTSNAGTWYYWGGTTEGVGGYMGYFYPTYGTGKTQGYQLTSAEDVATLQIGTNWHTPNAAEWQALIDNTTQTGATFTSTAGTTMTVPGTGYCNQGSTFDNAKGYYWTNELYYPATNSSKRYDSYSYVASNTGGEWLVDFMYAYNDAKIRAVYEPSFTTHTLTIIVNGQEYQYVCEEGQEVTVTAVPQAAYLFKWWSDEHSNTTATRTFTVDNDIEVEAVFMLDPSIPTHTATFYNYDGTQLYQTTVPVGVVPTYGGATPTKAYWDFAGWTPAITAMGDADVTYTATFTFESAAANVDIYQGASADTMKIVYNLDPKTGADGKTYIPVDMGYGVAWADRNVGATSTSNVGKYFAWSDTNPNRSWPSGGTAYGAINQGNSAYTNNYTLTATYDAAYQNMGSNWRMPTNTEWSDFLSNTTLAADGGTFKNKTDDTKTIFLPASGYYIRSTLDQPSYRYYWSSRMYKGTLRVGYSNKTVNGAYAFQNYGGSYYVDWYDHSGGNTNQNKYDYELSTQYYGMPVRAIYTPAYTTCTLTVNVGTKKYQYICQVGQEVTVTANAQNGYRFAYWSDNSGTNAARTFTMTGNLTTTANFEAAPVINYYDITVEADGTGYGTVDVSSINDVEEGTAISTSSQTLTIGETTVTATPTVATDEYTYAFSGWTDDEGNSLPATVTSDLIVRANFTSAKKQYTLAWDFAGGATATADGDYTHGTIDWGTAITAPANPTKDGYTFNGWNVTPAATMPAANVTYTAQWESASAPIVLYDDRENSFYNTFKTTYDGATGVIVTYNRQFTQGRWSTLCLPFDVNKAMFSTLNFGSRIYEFKYATGNADDGVNLYFSIAKSIEAGKGYIVNADAKLAARTSFTFSGVTMDLSADNGAELNSVTAYDNLTGSSTQGNLELVGTLRKGTLKGTAADNRYMGLKENKIYYPNITTGSTILAYRGIFRSITGTLNAERIRIIVDGEEKAELEVVNGELQDVQETKKFIENGVLYIERNGIIYDATGRKVE